MAAGSSTRSTARSGALASWRWTGRLTATASWVWLRPWGWTWVDDAPWGFAPFHYGRWLWWGEPLVLGAGAEGGAAGVRAGAGRLGRRAAVQRGRRQPPGAGDGLAAAWGRAIRTGRPTAPARAIVKRLNPHVPPGSLPPPAFGNRGVPGAVTLWPAAVAGAAPAGGRRSVARRRNGAAPPVAGRELHHNAPGRPRVAGARLHAPRPSVPLGDRADPMPVRRDRR